MEMRQSRITPFPPVTPVTLGEEKDEREEKSSSSTATATPWARACARTREESAADRAAAAFARLCNYYCQSFDRRHCPPSIQRDMIDAMKQGMTAKTICLCIDAAQEAERPTWAYARAVMARCIADGALTPEGFAARAARKRGGADRGGMNYDQRSYSPDELAGMIAMFDD